MRLLLALFSVLSLLSSGNALPDPSTCDADAYWSTVTAEVGKELADQLHNLVDGHTVIPYTSKRTDVWDALDVLDEDPLNTDNVKLIYAQRSEAKVNKGVGGWNREHVWPKSRGVGYKGPDTSDLFALRAADWNVNAVRNNRYYDNCGVGRLVCEMPAHPEAPSDSGVGQGSGRGFFQPPMSVRGDLARSLFYMAVRYNGAEKKTTTLRLTDDEELLGSDKPAESGGIGYMGKLSVLLEWHKADPVTEAERERNSKLCNQFQKNRNPFIDHPEWVEKIPWASLGTDHDEGEPEAEPSPSPSPSPTPPDESEPAPSPVSEPVEDEPEPEPSPEDPLGPGDLAVIEFEASSKSFFRLLALRPLKKGTTFSVTDAGWIDSSGEFYSKETGVLEFTALRDLKAGTLITYPKKQTPRSWYAWTKKGNFRLSKKKDSLLVFTGTRDAVDKFVYGFMIGQREWECDSSSAPASSSNSDLPKDLCNQRHHFSQERCHAGRVVNIPATRKMDRTAALERIADVDNWTFERCDLPSREARVSRKSVGDSAESGDTAPKGCLVRLQETAPEAAQDCARYEEGSEDRASCEIRTQLKLQGGCAALLDSSLEGGACCGSGGDPLTAEEEEEEEEGEEGEGDSTESGSVLFLQRSPGALQTSSSDWRRSLSLPASLRSPSSPFLRNLEGEEEGEDPLKTVGALCGLCKAEVDDQVKSEVTADAGSGNGGGTEGEKPKRSKFWRRFFFILLAAVALVVAVATLAGCSFNCQRRRSSATVPINGGGGM
uniref:Uncharacterized protein n=1 Tax=Chromera velia CCMP2878 TaxID=1169474 RepID=A0A0G4HW20_9ALVE|eukprot:Cvel_8935.t1-p1 / transcript=Cvel_8935.t1 / gene=Cvel_8935 / organism=Chromera_velia_CCMP2878 / gene_product=Extracellular ribonuclease, putative / transcript_product=Extracellular ribonuclease, putative / location=Cvel_scaffold503:24409-28235(-) / protein_length=771 / sequence_SO=supercontig / SO=protein_coding / is_pseudo=false